MAAADETLRYPCMSIAGLAMSDGTCAAADASTSAQSAGMSESDFMEILPAAILDEGRGFH